MPVHIYKNEDISTKPRNSHDHHFPIFQMYASSSTPASTRAGGKEKESNESLLSLARWLAKSEGHGGSYERIAIYHSDNDTCHVLGSTDGGFVKLLEMSLSWEP